MNKFILWCLFAMITVACSDSSSDSDGNSNNGSKEQVNIPQIELTCKNSFNCANNVADGKPAIAYYYMDSTVYAWGTARVSCTSGTCVGTINSWQENAQDTTAKIKIPSGDYNIAVGIDLNGDADFEDVGEPISNLHVDGKRLINSSTPAIEYHSHDWEKRVPDYTTCTGTGSPLFTDSTSDASKDYIDLENLSFTVGSDCIGASIGIENLPEKLTFNSSTLLDNFVSHQWGLAFDMDSDGKLDEGDVELKIYYLNQRNSASIQKKILEATREELHFWVSDMSHTGIEISAKIENNAFLLYVPHSAHARLKDVSTDSKVYFKTSEESNEDSKDFYPSKLGGW